MKKVQADFAIETKNNVVIRVGRSSILVPKTNFKGKGVRWFDDNKLLKKKEK